uniref:KASH domain-containing protein n=1 Tax=Acrobeloides nanus TaxID=290746 RepID=A0A914C3N9_9BILA
MNEDIVMTDSMIEQKIEEATKSAHEIFVEGCSSLYNDIQNAIDDLESGQEICYGTLEDRLKILMKQAEQLVESVPGMVDIVQLRLVTMNRAMEQLKIKQDNDQHKNETKDQSALAQFRKWLQSTENELDGFKNQISKNGLNHAQLQRLRADHQLLQLQIETEGRTLLTSAKRQLSDKCLSNDEKKNERRRRNLEALEQRWFVIWINSLENLARIDALVKEFKRGDSSESEAETDEEPILKRRKTFSGGESNKNGAEPPKSPIENEHTDVEEEDTIPFEAAEYESIPCTSAASMSKTPDSSQHSPRQLSDVEYENAFGQKVKNRSAMVKESITEELSAFVQSRPVLTPDGEDGWSSNGSGSRQHDVGYSSGENSVHEALNTLGSDMPATYDEDKAEEEDAERRKRIESSPVKLFYKTVPLDEAGITDTETPRPLINGVKWTENLDVPLANEELSDSMIVQADNTLTHCSVQDDYQDVLNMLENQETQFSLNLERLKQGTQWRELKSTTKRVSISSSKNSLRRSLPSENVDKASCDASSEESDELPLAESSTSSFLTAENALTRKRRHRKGNLVGANTPNSIRGFPQSLSNADMDQSIYIYNADMEISEGGSASGNNLMTQSLNLSVKSGNSGRRKLYRRKMHRSASDTMNLSLNLHELFNSPVYSSLCPEMNPPPRGFSPLYTSTLKHEKKEYPPFGRNHLRRTSVDSNSTTSTVHDSGDAHFEWDEYRDLADELMPSTIDADTPNSSCHAPLLASPIVDEDFQKILPEVDDPTGLNSLLSASKSQLLDSRSHLDDKQNLSPEKLNNLGRSAKENIKRLTAIVQANPRHITMDQINEMDQLRKEWKDFLQEIEWDSPPPLDPEHNPTICLPTILKEMKAQLKLLEIHNGSNLTIDEVREVIERRKQVWQSLLAQRDRLRKLSMELDDDDLNEIASPYAKTSTDSEISELLSLVEKSLRSIESSTTELENLRKDFESFHGLRSSLKSLAVKIDSFGDHGNVDYANTIQSEMELCQERMNALETVCNMLMSQLGLLTESTSSSENGHNATFVEPEFLIEFRQFREEFYRLRSRFDKILVAQCQSGSNQSRKRAVRNKTTSTNGDEVLLRRRDSDRQRRARAQNPQNLSGNNQRSLPNRIAGCVRESRFVQLLLGCTLMFALGALLISVLLDDSPPNNWRRQWGPQLDYVRGPPPV